MNDFAAEVDDLQVLKKFRCRAFICDAPAKAFVKQILNHNSHNGCNECAQVGFHLNRTLVFNVVSVVSGTLRTDNSFRERVHQNHHHTNIPSELEKIGIGMVSQFPLDPMHLVDLGVVRSTLG